MVIKTNIMTSVAEHQLRMSLITNAGVVMVFVIVGPRGNLLDFRQHLSDVFNHHYAKEIIR